MNDRLLLFCNCRNMLLPNFRLQHLLPYLPSSFDYLHSRMLFSHSNCSVGCTSKVRRHESRRIFQQVTDKYIESNHMKKLGR